MSAGRYRYGRITRRGSPSLRWALIEAALHGTTRSDRIGRRGRGLAVRKGVLKARVPVARVLRDEIHRLWVTLASRPLQVGWSRYNLTSDTRACAGGPYDPAPTALS